LLFNVCANAELASRYQYGMSSEEVTIRPGELRVAISNAVVQLHREHYGKGPTRAKTYIMDDLVVVVMRGGSTRLEETLTRAGEAERVRNIRQAFQDSLHNVFVQRIEELTGQRVEAFLSQSTMEPDVSVELFLLEGPAAPG
jgi:uncharacterized protein YbcI